MRSVCLAWDSLWVTIRMVLPRCLGSHLGVQVTGGLVRKDDGGVSDKGTGDGNSLALTSGKL